MPPQCPRRTGSGKSPSKPRATISSMCVAAAPPPPPCSCQEQVCTEETCTTTGACTKIKPEVCPHGLATDDGECHGPCHFEIADKHSLSREESRSVSMCPSKTSCCKATADKSQQAPADKMTPPVVESDTCCSGCPAKAPSSSSDNACCPSEPPPKVTCSPCGPDCGATEPKQEESCCPKATPPASANQCPAMQQAAQPEPPVAETPCCKSGGAIRSGPHINKGTAPATQQGPCGSRKPSLVRIADTKTQNQKKPPPGKQRSEASLCDKHKPPEPEEPAGPLCPHSGAGLFPAKAAQTPCLCVMPPAFNTTCTGNLAGNCTCNQCTNK